MMTYLEEEQQIQQTLEQIKQLLSENETIRAFKQIETKVKHQGLKDLEEEIKNLQKQVVQFEHYGKENAKQEALKRLDEANERYKNHPLVVSYREKLIEADDLLQYLTNKIQYQVNQQLEQEGKQ
jgi:cell fate (sporulation/competence/biofilm development) regulator YmcA (YheA/YmcA/DUF963 family)